MDTDFFRSNLCFYNGIHSKGTGKMTEVRAGNYSLIWKLEEKSPVSA